jgi:phenylpropionate dioxygenase-like ring-hydroxylating dioxygenase large terminal subunit
MSIDQELDRITGPILSDGTAVSSLVDLERHEVSMRVLSDPEIYQLELKRLFARAWTVLAHETEVPKVNDYVTRYIGEDPVIVVRGKDEKVNVLLNICTHRGMMVCRADAGNEKQFKCPYHGWTFNDTGKFVGSPVAKENMHGAFRTKDELGLPKARVETFAGFIFATWDPEAPTLSDYLGDIKFYQELMFDRTESGLEVLGPPQRFIIPANWKCAGEQHAGDGYHAMTLHRSLSELAQSEGDDASMYGIDVSANGHGLRLIDRRQPKWANNKEEVLKAQSLPPIERLKIMPPPGMTPEMVEGLEKRFSPDQIRILAEYPPNVGGIFPNMGTFSLEFPTPMGMSSVISWHAFVPKGPDHFEFFNWYLVEKDATQEVKDLCRRASTLAFGTTGFVETDDADTWPQMTAAARGTMGRQQTIKYGALTGEDQPLTGYWDEDKPFPGVGHLYPGFTKDDAQWNWWLRWRDFMASDPWSDTAHH